MRGYDSQTTVEFSLFQKDFALRGAFFNGLRGTLPLGLEYFANEVHSLRVSSGQASPCGVTNEPRSKPGTFLGESGESPVG